MGAGEQNFARDPLLAGRYARAQSLLERFNASRHAETEHRRALLEELFAHFGARAEIKPPLYCEFGSTIDIGADVFIDTGCVLIDAGPIAIGAASRLGPRVQLLTTSHPADSKRRREGWEIVQPVTIGENVGIGAGAIVCPGVEIGRDSLVAAGAVVACDVPAGAYAIGVPARIDGSACADNPGCAQR